MFKYGLSEDEVEMCLRCFLLRLCVFKLLTSWNLLSIAPLEVDSSIIYLVTRLVTSRVIRS